MGKSKFTRAQRRRLSEEGKKIYQKTVSGEIFKDVEAVSDTSSLRGNLDNFSVISQSGSQVDEVASVESVGADAQSSLDQALEEIAETRGATKIAGLKTMLRLLRSSVCCDSIQPRKKVITKALSPFLRKESSQFTKLALEILASFSITIGDTANEFFSGKKLSHQYPSCLTPSAESSTMLERLIHHGEIDENRVEAVYALTLTTYINCEDSMIHYELMETLGDLFMCSSEYPLDLTLAAVECWGLLTTLVPPSKIIAKIYDQSSWLHDNVCGLKSFVEPDEDPMLRAMACEVLALLIEYRYAIAQDGWRYETESKESPIGGLDERIQTLMHETAKKRGKKVRKDQRSRFRTILSSMEGENPNEEVTVGTSVACLTSWAKVFQFSIFRRALKTGLQVHLMNNPLLQEIFEIENETPRVIASKATSKRRSINRNQLRDRRSRMKLDFYVDNF